MTITIGSWSLPLLLTILAMGWAWHKGDSSADGGYFPDMTGFACFVGALIVSLVVWLVWALAT